ncbi:MAG: T9SS type A sorting domain-containing protein [Bacteroidetes bacterium]|nr:T9SS type A sorting domain-containing protein [Bacteroidota bacterium]MBS1980283.1 T9SS type A sorting domain-containing protein [Bacteroidota bacterium]
MRLVWLMILFCVSRSYAQLQLTSIIKTTQPQKTSNKSARVQSASSPLMLPFWDDFSFNGSQPDAPGFSHPSDSLWLFGQSVWVNTGMGINAPSYKVATFDGLDSTGMPYNRNIPTAKGVADRLVSRPLRLDSVNPSLRDSVFIFFYYQWKGRGEAPDPQDVFSLWFRGGSNSWTQVWSDTIKNHKDSVFIPVKIFITDTSYFHNDFQFRFQNFARLSGPFDTWQLDYVYVNNGQPKYFPYLNYKDFPDRAFTTPITSPFVQYQSLPVKHLLASGKSALTRPSVWVNNLRADKTLTQNGAEPRNLAAFLTTTTRVNKVVSSSTVQLDSVSSNRELLFQVPVHFTFDSLLNLNSIDPKTDSLVYTFQANIHQGDNSVKKSVVVHGLPTTVGDYDTIVYKGIDFRHNDTVRTNFKLKNYYAYDDGVAEYAITLTQPGAFAAYQFDMFYPQPDTLKAFDIYFPHVGDETYQVIKVLVYDTLVIDPSQLVGTNKRGVLTSQSLVVTRSANDSLIRVTLDSAVLVNKTFYIGWKQNSFAIIGIGLDKDSDSGQKLFYNVTGIWQQNTTIHGNVMIRPVFGYSNALKLITGIVEKKSSAYPNPNRGTFYLPPAIQGLQVMDVAGREVFFDREELYDKTQVTLTSASAGIYLMRYFDGVAWRTEKIMVLP